MHLGHALLLTQASLCTSERLLVGVTSAQLLNKKAYAHLIEDFETRKQNVLGLLGRLNPRLKADIFELSDPVGKAGTDPTIEVCILTREVEKGGHMINEKRKENGLNTLDLVFADMVLCEEDPSEGNKFSNKTSSTLIRGYVSQKKKTQE